MVSVILLAAGSGKRMNMNTPKQFMDVNGKPLIYYSLKRFSEAGVDEIVIVTGEEHIDFCKDLVERYGFDKVKSVVPGGDERYDSVYSGLKTVSCEGYDIVLIHDSARANISLNVINEVVNKTIEVGAAIPVVPVKDTIKRIDDEANVVDTPPRSSLVAVQTPQGFTYADIDLAYVRMREAGDSSITDDSMVMEKYGELKVATVQGDYNNIKVTTPEDAESIVRLLQRGV